MMGKTSICLLGVLVLVSAPALAAGNDVKAAAKPTFNKDILPLLQEKCQSCHRPSGLDLGGMVAPMSLMTYDDVRPWAKTVARVVQSHEMPPWDAAPEYNGLFVNERTLTEAEIETIVRWSKTGAAEGRPEDRPEPRQFPSGADGWTLPDPPDLVLQLPERVWVGDEVDDWQPVYPIKLTEDLLPEDRWIKAIEFKPDSEVVHHIVAYAIAPGGVGGEAAGRGMLGGIAPGSELDVHPEGFGMRLAKGSTLAVSMHYHKEPGEGTGSWDRSSLALWFHDKPVKHDVRWDAIGSFQFEIPPQHPNWTVGASRTFEEDTLLLALSPHMHFRGKSATYVAYYPDGRRENLLEVPSYDYNWQTHYVYKEPKLLPAGTRLDVRLVFDNSEGNGSNPNPNAVVRFGERSDDEMAFGWIDYCNAEPLAGTAAATGGR